MKASPQQIFVLPFSHLDLFWLGDKYECLSRGFHVIAKAIRLCEEEPSFRFLIEDAVFLKAFCEAYPEMQERIIRLAESGRLEMPSKWAAITVTQVNGETIVRNLQIGLREVDEICGVRPGVIHLGDLPGVPVQFPQILKRCGIDAVVTSRGGPRQVPLFRWQSPDGSRVLNWFAPYCYCWGISIGEPEDAFLNDSSEKLAKEAAEVMGNTPSHVLMHYGWDLSVPTRDSISNLRKWSKASGIQARFTTLQEFFDAVSHSDDIPVLEGEIPTVWGNWPDSAYLDVTIHHAQAERELLMAERMLALDVLEGRKIGVDLTQAWKALLESIDHNYSANAVEDSHATKNRLTVTAFQQVNEVVQQRMLRRASEVERSESSIPIVVFNPSSFTRMDRVHQRILFYGERTAPANPAYNDFHLVDESGVEIPFQVERRRSSATGEADIEFVARDVPELGYKTYYVKPGIGESQFESVGIKGGDNQVTVDVESIRFTVLKHGGEISIKGPDGETLAETISLRAVEQLESNQVMQLDSTGRIFPFICSGVSVVNDGPLGADVELMGEVGGVDAKVVVKATRGIPRVDLTCTVNWPADLFLRIQLHCTLPGGRDEAAYIGCPFGANSLDNVISGSGPYLPDEVTRETWLRTREAQDWFLVSGRDSESSLAVATERKLVEFLPEGFAINILSGMTAKWISPDKVFHPFASTYTNRFSIRVVDKNDIDAAARRGEELLLPLRSVVSYNQSPVVTRQASSGYLRLQGDGVRMTCLKPAGDGNGVILRLLECRGMRTKASVELSGAGGEVWESNLLEEPSVKVDPSMISLEPYEIKTLRFST